MYSLKELAAKLDLSFSGEGDCTIKGLNTLAKAGSAELAFLAHRRYLPQLATTKAAAVILPSKLLDQCPTSALVADDPYLYFARVSALFDHSPTVSAGIHPSATVSAEAMIDASASIGANAVIEAGTRIGPGVVIAANVYIGHDCTVEEGSRIFANAVLYHSVSIGKYCTIHAQAVLGSDGFGFAPGPQGWEKIHQLGGVRLGNAVEIGACTTIDRGAIEDTLIEDGVIIDNLVQIAHNCHIGKNTAIAGCTGLAGSTIIGANCTLAGGVGVVGHVEICDNVHITGMTMVTKSITVPGSYSSGTAMSSTHEWKRSAVRFAQLNSIEKRLAHVEAKLDNKHN
ncbi:MAG: UDP-3-O-(3-hydroxymyristoyl)glucosamine N-acyltransferase [Parahaliea sp.]